MSHNEGWWDLILPARISGSGALTKPCGPAMIWLSPCVTFECIALSEAAQQKQSQQVQILRQKQPSQMITLHACRSEAQGEVHGHVPAATALEPKAVQH